MQWALDVLPAQDPLSLFLVKSEWPFGALPFPHAASLARMWLSLPLLPGDMHLGLDNPNTQSLGRMTQDPAWFQFRDLMMEFRATKSSFC